MDQARPRTGAGERRAAGYSRRGVRSRSGMGDGLGRQALSREHQAPRATGETSSQGGAAVSDLIQLYANANIRIGELERENAALREDKARLDWIDVDPIDHLSKIEFYWCDHSSILKIRANIDAARKEAKP